MWRKVTAASKWLYPGLGVKRWLLLLFLGIATLSLGFARLFYGAGNPLLTSSPGWLALTHTPSWAPTMGLVLVGSGLLGLSIYQLNR